MLRKWVGFSIILDKHGNLITNFFVAPPSWRYNLIDILSKLTKKICPTYQVSHEFLNIMWNMIHIYWHQIKPDEINIKIDEDFWIRKISELQNCSLEIVNGGFYMEGRGDFVSFF